MTDAPRTQLVPAPRSEVDPFMVMDVMEAARRAEEAGAHVIHMEVGQPGTPAPAGARAALARALESDPLGYTVALGLPALRARIARLYGEWYGVDLDPERVVITAGSSAGFILSFLALFQPRARVAIGEPGYPSYRNILRALDMEPVGLMTRAEARFQPVPADLAAAGRLDGLLVASPANPTGTMLDRAALSALIGAAQEAGAAFISDEIYHGISYGGRAVSALEISDEVVVINSFSKYFSMTGWRIGWLVVPPGLVRTLERLVQNLFICAPHAAQVAALAALDCTEELEGNLALYARNRARLLEGLPRAGFDRLAPPDGAFYIWAEIGHLGAESRALAREILAEAGVAVTPGVDFDPGRGGDYLRFSYARSEADIEEALRRLQAFGAARGWTKG